MAPTQDKDGRPLFAAFLASEDDSHHISPAVLSRGWDKATLHTGGVANAVRNISQTNCPRILLVDLSNSNDPRADMQSLAEVCEPDTAVIAVGKLNDVSFFRDLIHAGVQDYLVKPLNLDALDEAIEVSLAAIFAAEEAEDPHFTPEDGTKTAVIGVRGGLGASSLAANLAAHFAARKEPTLLLDMDLHFGITALLFDQEPGHGLTDALDNPSRVDGLFLERAVIKPRPHLSILASEAPLGSTGRLPDGSIKQLSEALSDSFVHVFMDLPRQLLAEQADALEHMTDIILLTDLSLASARDCIRLMGFMRKAAPRASVHVVAGKHGLNPDEVTQKDFENSVEHAIDLAFPYDQRQFSVSAREGKPLSETAPNSKVATSVAALADLLTKTNETAQTAEKKGWIKKIFSK